MGKDTGVNRLVTGTIPGTTQPAINPKPLDVNSWAVLAFPELATRYSLGLEWGARRPPESGACYCQAGKLWGFGFSSVTAKDQLWPEGMAHVALARRALGQEAEANAIIEQLTEIQKIQAGTSAEERGALPSAYPTLVKTGYLTPLIVYERRFGGHAGATAWMILARTGYDPYLGKFVKADINTAAAGQTKP